MNFRAVRNAAAALMLLPSDAIAQGPLTTRCELAPLMAAWTEFGEKGKLAH